MTESTPRTPELPPVAIDGGASSRSEIIIARPVILDQSFLPVRSNDEMLLQHSSRGSAWADIGLLLAVMIAFEVVMGWLIGAADPVNPTDPAVTADARGAIQRQWLIPLLSARALVVAMTIGGILLLRGQSLASIGVRSKNLVKDGLVGLATAAAAGALVWIIMFTIMLVWSGLMKQMTENAKRIAAMVPHLPIVSFVFLALVIGMYEELVFRGFLLTRLRRGIGNWPLAMVLSCALFTVLHAPDQTPAALIGITVLSILFSLVTIWRGSIIPAIVAHTVWNLSQFLLLSFLEGEKWT